MERKGHMVGVVVSWDTEMQAPPEWKDRMYSNSEVTYFTPFTNTHTDSVDIFFQN